MALRGRWLAGLVLSAVPGCILAPSDPGSTQMATSIDPQEAQASYWYGQPASVSVSGEAFAPLWEAAVETARAYHFTIDRTDYRLGVLTTDPLLSKQFWEIWYRDVVDPAHLIESSLASERRTIRFEFERLASGAYQVRPKVLIERYSLAERRVTSVWQYREAVMGSSDPVRTSLAGEQTPSAYWYAVGRDHALERALAEGVQARMKRSAERRASEVEMAEGRG